MLSLGSGESLEYPTNVKEVVVMFVRPRRELMKTHRSPSMFRER
jgi:hypothetical protein